MKKKLEQAAVENKNMHFEKSIPIKTRQISILLVLLARLPCVHLANSYDILFRQEQLTQSKYAFVPKR